MITLRSKPTDRLIELGGGANPLVRPNVDIRTCYDAQGNPTVDFTASFEEPLPIKDEDFDGVFSQYAIEHISWRKVPQFIAEVFRILKPGGKAVIVTANTYAQLKWIEEHPDGWDGKNFFESASCLLFGDQDYPENSHRSFFSLSTVDKMFKEAGFTQIKVQPYGARDTDLCIEAVKPHREQSNGEKRRHYLPLPPNPDPERESTLAGFPVKILSKEEFGPTPGHIVLGDPLLPNPSPEIDWEKHGLDPNTPVILKQANERFQREDSAHPNIIAETHTIASPERSSETTTDTMQEKKCLVSDASPVKIEAEGSESKQAVLGDRNAGKERSPSPLVQSTILYQVPRELLFDKTYFNGGAKVGGYAREGYWDYPAHVLTARYVLDRQPKSVLELGCARGYVLKRLQDAGVRAQGLEISKHCWLTRAADGIIRHDICNIPWPIGDKEFDLCFSQAVLEHVPEDLLPDVIREMARTCKRVLHGIDFGEHDDGFDRTHVTLRDKSWWQKLFNYHFSVRDSDVEILDKEELERGEFPQEVLLGDNKVKLNVGCYNMMFHHGWINMDVLDLRGFAQAYQYTFMPHDVRHGLPYPTCTVDLIYASHFLEHLTYQEGLAFLRDCRRVIKPGGVLRLIVPDTALLTECYLTNRLGQFDEINDDCAASPTAAGKLWSLLTPNHQAAYDEDTLDCLLDEAGFVPVPSQFRVYSTGTEFQIQKETLDVLPCLSLFMNAIPKIG